MPSTPEDSQPMTHQDTNKCKNYIFIALIHPIQLTIALPVGMTGPAKQQQKQSCINYWQDQSRSVHLPGAVFIKRS